MDLLTKPIVSPSAWSRFCEFTGLGAGASVDVNNQENSSRLKKLVALLSGLIGVACWQPVQELAKVAKCVTVAAVAASIACLMGGKGREDLSKSCDPALAWTKASKESSVEKRKIQEGTREDEPVLTIGRDTSPTGSLGRDRLRKPWMQQLPHLSALRAPVRHVGLGTDLPWELMRFQSPPTGTDRWECLGVGLGGGEWWVRVVKKSRVRAYHPLHRGTPMSIGRLSATRVTVTFSRGNPREVWRRTVVTDDWIENRNCDVHGIYEWCGYAFFYMKFGPSREGGSETQERHDFSPGPTPSPGSVAPTGGYGNFHPGASRAAQRGQAALPRDGQLEIDEGTTYDGTGFSARGSDFTEGGRMTGYDLRLHGCGRTGEVNLDPGREAREQAHASEDSLPPEADQLPVWMGIATEVGFPPGLHDPDDSTSDGSFCKVDCG